jgi:ActR/RegA family two-component response regulator
MAGFDEAPCSPAPEAEGRPGGDAWPVPAPLQTGPQPGHAPVPGIALPKMIIVEDAPLIAFDLAETMKDLGFDVRATAFTHDQALAEIERSVPDYAVIDLHLGMGHGERDGEALLSMLSARGCRCLVFSGDESACRRVAERYPRISVLTKPAEPGALAREIARLRQLAPQLPAV